MEVKARHRNQDQSEILSGLSADMRMVRYPDSLLKEGTRIAAVNGAFGN